MLSTSPVQIKAAASSSRTAGMGASAASGLRAQPAVGGHRGNVAKRQRQIATRQRELGHQSHKPVDRTICWTSGRWRFADLPKVAVVAAEQAADRDEEGAVVTRGLQGPVRHGSTVHLERRQVGSRASLEIARC